MPQGKSKGDDSVNICVYGASSAQLKDIYYEKTQELGRAMDWCLAAEPPE